MQSASSSNISNGRLKGDSDLDMCNWLVDWFSNHLLGSIHEMTTGEKKYFHTI